MNTTKINSIEAIMLILTIVVSHTILALPQQILTTTKSATLLNLIYISIITLFFGILIYKLFKNFAGSDIIDISNYLGGNLLKNIVGIIFLIYFFASAGILLRNFCESLKIIYYPMTNIVFIILLFIITLCIANRLDFAATLKTNTIILPLVLASIIFLFFSSINKFQIQRMFPILGEGFTKTFFTGLINISSFSGIIFLYFIPPMLKEPSQLKSVILLSIGISALYLILCVSTLLFMFSFFIDTNEITPLYNVTRYIEFGSFFQRLESIFVFIWILAFSCYLSIILKFSLKIFQKITNIENRKALIDIFALLLFAISIIPKNYSISHFFEINVFPYLVIGIVFVLSLSILILANFKKRKASKFRKESFNEQII